MCQTIVGSSPFTTKDVKPCIMPILANFEKTSSLIFLIVYYFDLDLS